MRAFSHICGAVLSLPFCFLSTISIACFTFQFEICCGIPKQYTHIFKIGNMKMCIETYLFLNVRILSQMGLSDSTSRAFEFLSKIFE